VSLVYVHQFSISLDGFGTGEGQSRDAYFGHAGERLHEWMFTTRWWNEKVGQSGGTGGIDDAFLERHDRGIGAEIMGAGKWGFPGWHEDPNWKGAWGPNPPFHTPVLSSPTTRARPSRWRAARRSTSSTSLLPRRSRRPASPQMARTYASAEAPP
jgi:hypothetical protein